MGWGREAGREEKRRRERENRGMVKEERHSVPPTSTAIFSLPLIQVGQLLVTGKSLFF